MLLLERNLLTSIFLCLNGHLSEFVKFVPSCWVNIARMPSRDFSLGLKYRLISAVYEINDVAEYMYPFGDAASDDYKMINYCSVKLFSVE